MALSIEREIENNKDGLRWIPSLYLKRYAVTLNGTCYNTAKNTRPIMKTDFDNEGKPRISYRVYDDRGISRWYTAKELVIEAFYSLPEELWKDSPFAKDIREAKAFANMPAKDKVELTEFVFSTEKSRKYWLTNTGDLWLTHPLEKQLLSPTSSGYKNRQLRTVDGIYKNFAIHREVALRWCKVPQELLDLGYTTDTLVVNHKDGNKLNNVYTNLEWVTSVENASHASKTGLMKTAISDELLEKVWQELSLKKSNVEIARITNLNPGIISNIRHGVSPRYKTNKYKWDYTSKSDRFNLATKRIKIIDLYKSGKDVTAISFEVGSSWETVKRILEDEGLYRADPNYKTKAKELPKELRERVYQALLAGKTNVEISNEFGIGRKRIADIRSHAAYKNETTKMVFPTSTRSYSTPKETRLKIYKALEKGLTNSEISRLVNINESTIRRIRSRERYADETVDYKWRESSVTDEEVQNRMERNRKIIEMVKDGKSLAEIGRTVGLSLNSVKRFLLRNNINYPTRLNNNS